MSDTPLYQSDLNSLTLLTRGKVRDVYAIDDELLLFVASDRLSAFDVVLDDPIPDKGRVLTALSVFWFHRFRNVVANHLSDVPVQQVLSSDELEQVRDRALVVRRLKPLPVEAIVRGYLIGSGWKDYQASGQVSGIALPPGLAQAARLPDVIFTPSTKAEHGLHDENICFEQMVAQVGAAVANEVRRLSLSIYSQARDFAAGRGIIIADTKFEFGLDSAGGVVLIDEVLTPDSSRFWPAEAYQEGTSPPSFDKQYVRDYLETLDWDKTAPAPRLPSEVIAKTTEKYRQAERRLMGS